MQGPNPGLFLPKLSPGPFGTCLGFASSQGSSCSALGPCGLFLETSTLPTALELFCSSPVSTQLALLPGCLAFG